MKPSEISVQRVSPDMFELTIDGTTHTLSVEEVQNLGFLFGFSGRPHEYSPYKPEALPLMTADEINTLLEKGKIHAIKAYRARNQCGLKDAKEVIDAKDAEIKRLNCLSVDPGDWCNTCQDYHRW